MYKYTKLYTVLACHYASYEYLTVWWVHRQHYAFLRAKIQEWLRCVRCRITNRAFVSNSSDSSFLFPSHIKLENKSKGTVSLVCLCSRHSVQCPFPPDHTGIIQNLLTSQQPWRWKTRILNPSQINLEVLSRLTFTEGVKQNWGC